MKDTNSSAFTRLKASANIEPWKCGFKAYRRVMVSLTRGRAFQFQFLYKGSKEMFIAKQSKKEGYNAKINFKKAHWKVDLVMV